MVDKFTHHVGKKNTIYRASKKFGFGYNQSIIVYKHVLCLRFFKFPPWSKKYFNATALPTQFLFIEKFKSRLKIRLKITSRRRVAKKRTRNHLLE